MIAIALGLIAGIGLVRVARRVLDLARRSYPLGILLPTLRRIGWTAVAQLVLGFTAWRIADTAGAAPVISNLILVVFVLLVGAADISWEMLTETGA